MDHFPAADALCETCGYALRDLPGDGVCPECGEAVEDSNPRRRNGPAWHHHRSPQTFVNTSRDLAFRPRQTFRAMDFGGSNAEARAFLCLHALIVAILVFVILLIADRQQTLRPTLSFHTAFAYLAGPAVLLLTYIEAAGVTYFARQRRWRIPFHHAERLACYAAVGMPPAALIITKIYLLYLQGVTAWLLNLLPGAQAIYTPGNQLFVTMSLGLTLALILYDTLIYLAVRQVRFANN